MAVFKRLYAFKIFNTPTVCSMLTVNYDTTSMNTFFVVIMSVLGMGPELDNDKYKSC